MASEVKTLADQTRKATEEIGLQIGEVQNSTSAAVDAIQGIAAIINEISAIAAAISASVEQQGATTKAIARNIQQAATGNGKATSLITAVQQDSAETLQIAGALKGVTDELGQQSEGLKRAVGAFIAETCAA